MNQQLKYIFLLIVVIAAAQTAIADPVPYQAEADPNDPAYQALYPTTTTTSTTTTTTLPTILRCPDALDGATAGSDSGYNYWSFDPADVCSTSFDLPGDINRLYCFQNPYVKKQLPNLSDQTEKMTLHARHEVEGDFVGTWKEFISAVGAAAHRHTEDCFICACYRNIGCFPPGIKITMADSSLRNIEDVRAGDSVRNAKTGAPVRIRQVIEGPEPLPLLRFGFEGTTVTTSQAHPVLTAAGLKQAIELKKDDTVFDAQGHPHALTILETLPLEEGQRVINVKLEAASSDANERLIVSDGIITGDIVLQGLLKNKR